ncbi:MAG: TatD family hydrolase [Tannerella sp.]|nr:TatD family hydrolase [Tannerella sp.]
MIYCDIHTHRLPLKDSDGRFVLLNRIFGKDELLPAPVRQSLGIHPWYIKEAAGKERLLSEYLGKPSVWAIGEAGLDKGAEAPFPLQEKVFREQAEWAEEKGKPLIIHCVRAWSELLAARKALHPRQTWIVHGFRGKAELAAQLSAQGLWLSFGERFQTAALKAADPQRLLVETDESLLPIALIYHRLALALETEEADFAAQVLRNYTGLFPNIL